MPTPAGFAPLQPDGRLGPLSLQPLFFIDASETLCVQLRHRSTLFQPLQHVDPSAPHPASHLLTLAPHSIPVCLSSPAVAPLAKVCTTLLCLFFSIHHNTTQQQ